MLWPVLALFVPLQGEFSPSDYVRSETRIRARDGVELYTVVYAPKQSAKPLPILLVRTPYDASGNDVSGAQLEDLRKAGYIFAFQDIRGHYKSSGTFVMTRPMRDPKDLKAIDEATDAWDTTDWLVKNVPHNNGKVGMYGISYDGWTALIAGLDPHPALKAVSPQAAPVDMWVNDDFHRNGAFRLSYGFEYAYAMEHSKEWTPYPFESADMYDWYLKLGPLSNVQKLFKGQIPTWTGFVAHPNHDAYWTDRNAISWMKTPKVPSLIVAGWWDQEDPVGPQIAFRELTQRDPDAMVRLVVGPWNHGGWVGSGRRLDSIDFGADTGMYFRQRLQKPFFDYYLKGEGQLSAARCTVFQTGSNRWQTYDNWPPKRDGKNVRLYLGPDGRLTFSAPAIPNGEDSYVSNPADPVPYRPRPIEPTYGKGSRWFTWQVQDQRFLKDRSDVRSWSTEPLAEEVTLTGDAIAHLYASTTGTDSDWVVKLIDVGPDGYQLMRNAEVVRARFRDSGAKPEPVPSDKPIKYDIDLHWTDHTFKKGHRIMVQVQSSWFPVIDRNPQTFVSNIFEAKESDYQTATQRIYRSQAMPSNIEVRTR